MFDWCRVWLRSLQLSPTLVEWCVRMLGLLLLALLCVLCYMVLRRLLLRLIEYVAAQSESHWDDIFIEHKVFIWLSHIVPAMTLFLGASWALPETAHMTQWLERTAMLYMVGAIALSLDATINAAWQIYCNYDISRQMPLKGLFQLLKVIVYLLCAIVTLGLLLNKTPFYLLSGLGALSAVLMLVFKDSILGLVAGVQLGANRMVATGDWISMPKYSADGVVLDVALTTVKVQNFDRTITTIPTYALISEAFKNWRGMQESGGRRIKRSLNIDVHSIKFCDEVMLERLEAFVLLQSYMQTKSEELGSWNRSRGFDQTDCVNERRLTNIGSFRAYIQSYLEQHMMIDQEATLLVRQLAPTTQGVPLEIYAFCRDTNWVVYENVQADIFDHLLAVVPLFDLRVFQSPSGADIRDTF